MGTWSSERRFTEAATENVNVTVYYQAFLFRQCHFEANPYLSSKNWRFLIWFLLGVRFSHALLPVINFCYPDMNISL